MKFAILAALVVVASAYETETEDKDKRQILFPGAVGYGVGYPGYGGYGLGGFYGAGYGYGAGYPAVWGRKRRAAEEESVEDTETEHKEKRQILFPGAVGYGVGYPGYGVGLGGFYGAGYGYGAGYPAVWGRKRRAAEETEDKEKRQILFPGAVGYGVGYPGYGVGLGGFYGAGYGYGYPVWGRKRREAEEASVEETVTEDKEKRQILFPGAVGYGVGYPGYGVGLGGFYGAGYGYGAGYPAVWGRKRRAAEETEDKEKRQILFPGAVGYGVGYPGYGVGLGGLYGAGYGYGAGYPGVWGRKRRAAEAAKSKSKRWVYGPGYGYGGLGYGYGGFGYPAVVGAGYPIGAGAGVIAPGLIL